MAEIMFPVGRMVGGGSLYKMFPVKDNLDKVKMQPDGVTPMVKCNFGVAILKTPGHTHWSQSDWGQKVAQVGAAGFPNGEFNSPTFAWKIIDGDSAVPNKKGNAPNKQAGYPGSWVVWFSQSWLPKLCDAKGTRELTEPDAIVPGYFVQVLADVTDNKPSQSPGVYMNPKAVALAGYGEKIASTGEVDTTTAGFGGALPPGATAAPVGVMVAPATAAVNLAIPGVAVPGVAVQVAAAPAIAVAPSTAYMMPPVGAAPTAIAPPPVAAAPRMMTKQGTGETAPYDMLIANQWTDALLAAHGWVG